MHDEVLQEKHHVEVHVEGQRSSRAKGVTRASSAVLLVDGGDHAGQRTGGQGEPVVGDPVSNRYKARIVAMPEQ